MTFDRPTGSVSGQRSWEWNRLLDARKGGRSARGADPDRNRPRDRQAGHRLRSYQEQVSALRRELEDANAELERRDRRLRYIIDHYERLLEEKYRRSDAPTTETSEGGPVATLVSRASRLLSAR